MKKHFYVLFLFCLPVLLTAQTSTVTPFVFQKKATISLNGENDLWKPTLKVNKLPKPDQGADEMVKQAVKQQQEKNYRGKRNSGQQSQAFTLPPPGMFQNFIGNNFNYFLPNDNDMAISDSNIVASVTNTTIWSKNLNTGVVYGTYTLHNLSLSLGLQNEEFDPKIMYDPQADRFVFICLNGFTPSSSNIVVGFSQTNSSYGNWNFYVLPGNPLNNNKWTDFPMLAITEKEVFLTINLIYPDSTWQAGFSETIIWQMKKEDGYSGSNLTSVMHSNIGFNGEPLRNLCPVKGGSGLYGPNMYFLSNRNFAASNDTTFLVEVTDTIGSPGLTVNVTPVISNIGYHMPPDADQTSGDKLATNDARVLGAFYENNKIQFAGNCLDTVTGNIGFYHGTIDNVSTSPSLTATIYADTLYDLGYPNISYAGNGPADDRSLISILYSASTVHPSCGAILYDGVGDYSTISTIKAGTSYINMLTGGERWGDYTGNQRKYNQPGTVWMSVQYAITNHQTRTWIAEISANSSVGIEPVNTQDESLLYPNPVGEMMTIDFNLNSSETILIKLFDANGKLVKHLFRGAVISGPNSFSLQTSALTSGIYFLKITGNENRIIASKKLVKE